MRQVLWSLRPPIYRRQAYRVRSHCRSRGSAIGHCFVRPSSGAPSVWAKSSNAGLDRIQSWSNNIQQDTALLISERPAAATELAPVADDLYSEEIVSGLENEEDWPQRQTQSSRVLHNYEKWHALAYDPAKLAIESNFELDVDPQARRLVDLPENHNDVRLWACLLEFRQRRDGTRGAVAVWEAICSRATLHTVEGDAAHVVWGDILAVAVLNENMLYDVWQYAEWLYTTHDVQWPRLHETVLAHFIHTGRHDEAVRWQLRLSPNFDLGRQAFISLLQRHILDDDAAVQETLRSVYRTSAHRGLYDHIVPFLYASGKSALARRWRRLLILYSEAPQSLASRPFLRFLNSYYALEPLGSQEKVVAGLEAPLGHEEEQGTQKLFQLVNRVHGLTFGVTEKVYSDGLGARLFASTWIALDLAIQVVSALGVREIGPLSLQSIALRESSLDQLVGRIQQLQASQISIGTSSYSRAVEHFALSGQHDSLVELVQSDLHPDVFDDVAIQTRAFGYRDPAESWKAYRLVVAVRLAVSSDSATSAWNILLVEALASRKKAMTLRVLDDMAANGVRASPSTANLIARDVLEHVSLHREEADLEFYVALCHHLTGMKFLMPAEVIQTLLYRLGRQKEFEGQQRLAFHILSQYTNNQHAGRAAAMAVHKSYLPVSLQANSPLEQFQVLPPDMTLTHERHPIQQIFDAKLQSSIIRWGFRWGLHGSRPPSVTLSLPPLDAPPEQFYFAHGIRFLAQLRKKGVFVQPNNVRKKTMLRLAELYGSGDGDIDHRKEAARERNRLTLAEAKQLCETAFGEAFLPPLAELPASLSALASTMASRQMGQTGRPQRLFSGRRV